MEAKSNIEQTQLEQNTAESKKINEIDIGV